MAYVINMVRNMPAAKQKSKSIKEDVSHHVDAANRAALTIGRQNAY
jgi:hypothetical protein